MSDLLSASQLLLATARTQADLASDLGVTQPTVCRIIHGYQQPSKTLADRIAQTFHTTAVLKNGQFFFAKGDAQ